MKPSDVEQACALSDPDTSATQLATIRESQWFDRKSGRIDAKKLAETLVAFANAEGGVVAVGIHDGNIDPVNPSHENDLRQAAHDFTEPPVRAYIESLHTRQGLVLLIEVEPGQYVHQTTKGECYLRIGDESRRLNYAQRQELEYDRGPQPFDGTPCGATREDLSTAAVTSYQDLLGSTSPELMFRARSLLTRDSELTAAAELLFGEHPQTYFPSAYIRVLRYLDDERGTGSSQNLAADGDIRIEGSLVDQVHKAAEVVDSFVPSRRVLSANGHFERLSTIPHDAWLEGIVNAVVHRSYSMSGDHIRIEIFPSRIEVTSPGRFPGLVDPRHPLDISRHARNPRIARVFSDLGITQELGEGIRRIFNEMRRQGLTDPIYEQTSQSVRLVLPATDALPDDMKRNIGTTGLSILSVLRATPDGLSTGEVVDLLKVSRPTVLRYLTRLRDNKLIISTGKSPRDPRARWKLS